MLLELYIMYSIVAFVSFFIALYFSKGITNIFVWPLAILFFSVLIFASNAIIVNGQIITEPGIYLLNLGMVVLSFILFVWDLIDKFATGGFE